MAACGSKNDDVLDIIIETTPASNDESTPTVSEEPETEPTDEVTPTPDPTPEPTPEGHAGTRSDPCEFGDEITFTAQDYSGEHNVEYTLTFNELWDSDRVKSEYPDYLTEGKIAARCTITTACDSTDDAVDFSLNAVFITEAMNEEFAYFQPVKITDMLWSVYSGGVYDVIVMSNDDLSSMTVPYVKIDYTSASGKNEIIWVSLSSDVADSISNTVENRFTTSDDTSVDTAPETDEEFIYINFGEQISLDFAEIVIDGASITETITPDDTSGYYYRYYEADEGEKYVYLYGTIKNISGNTFEFADNMSAFMTFDEKYNYDAFIMADEGGKFSYIYAYLDPLRSEKFYIVATVPDELIDQYNQVEISFGFKNNFRSRRTDLADDSFYYYSVIVTK